MRAAAAGLASALLLLHGCSASDTGAPERRLREPRDPLPAVAGNGAPSPPHASSTFGATTSGPAQPGLAMVDQVIDPNAGICEIVRLVADPKVPEMMIVLDRSGSMQEGGRWAPSVSAVKRITEELAGKVDFGLSLFPDPANQSFNGIFGGGGGDRACAPGLVVVPVAEDSAGTISGVLDMTQPLGGTPTAETLEGILNNYVSVPLAPDDVARQKYLLLVTDGQPTCPVGQGSDVTPADVDASNAAIEALAAASVPTYVIGYDTTGPGNEGLATVLDGFAQRGGTGDTQHRPVEDETSLLQALQQVAGSIVECTLSLDNAPPEPEYVLVTLDGEQLKLNEPDGWVLMGDKTIELTGAACETFKSGSHQVNASVQCEPVK